MAPSQNVAQRPHFIEDIVLSAALSRADAKRIERLTKAGQLKRLRPGMYVNAALTDPETELVVRRNWQRIAGAMAPGGVVSHISAMTSGLQAGHLVTISHPTINHKTVRVPGLAIMLLPGPGPLAFDLPLRDTGLYWAGRTRVILENLGKKAPRRVGREAVEKLLVTVLNCSGANALDEICDQAASLCIPLGKEKEAATLRSIIGALLGTHARGELRTPQGLLATQGTPVDTERMARFEVLAAYLRRASLPHIQNKVPLGIARHHFAFVESYFSNYVEGIKFDIDEAREIILNNRPSANRLKDSHDLISVFRLATTAPFRNNPPVAGADFLEGLEAWHADMLRMRPEANPGRLKLENNYAGNTKFVAPEMVRGTLEQGSRLALSVPEGMARAIYYAFLVSEIHPFDDGNGRLSRLTMNAELARVGLTRVIIPTPFHSQYVDCARNLTRNNDPDGFVRSIAKMANWCAQFNYSDVQELIQELKQTNALE